MIKTKFYWLDIDKSIEKCFMSCLTCQQIKIYKHTKAPIQQFHITSAQFQSVHTNLVGPLLPAKSKKSHT